MAWKHNHCAAAKSAVVHGKHRKGGRNEAGCSSVNCAGCSGIGSPPGKA